MKDIQVFNNPEFGELRTIEEGDKIYFVATDAARMLGYAKPSNAVSAHCKGALKRGIPTSGGVQQMNVIPEGDLYRLIVNSELPSAEKFESWVFDEVLPAIRKTGGYSVKQAERDKTKEMRAEAMLKNADSRRAKLLLEIAAASHIDGYKEMIMTKTANMLAGEPFLPMPKSGRERHDLGWYCERIGKGKNWASPLGKILKKNGIKKEQGVNGEYAEDHARGDIHKQVQNFEWYADFMFPQLRTLGFDVVKE